MMTEQCKHKWEWRYFGTTPRCRECGERMTYYGVERRLNATERLSVKMARTIGAQGVETTEQWGALRAYADTLEGK